MHPLLSQIVATVNVLDAAMTAADAQHAEKVSGLIAEREAVQAKLDAAEARIRELEGVKPPTPPAPTKPPEPIPAGSLAAIKTGIAKAKAKGGTVRLKPGRYKLDGSVIIPKGVILEGESRDRCILIAKPSGQRSVVKCDGGVARSLTLDANASADLGGEVLGSGEIDNCLITRSKVSGVGIGASDGARVTRNEFVNVGLNAKKGSHGIYGGPRIKNAVIAENEIDGLNIELGIKVRGFEPGQGITDISNIRIINNTIGKTNYDESIYVDNPCKKGKLTGIHILGNVCAKKQFVRDASDVTIGPGVTYDKNCADVKKLTATQAKAAAVEAMK